MPEKSPLLSLQFQEEPRGVCDGRYSGGMGTQVRAGQSPGASASKQLTRREKRRGDTQSHSSPSAAVSTELSMKSAYFATTRGTSSSVLRACGPPLRVPPRPLCPARVWFGPVASGGPVLFRYTSWPYSFRVHWQWVCPTFPFPTWNLKRHPGRAGCVWGRGPYHEMRVKE